MGCFYRLNRLFNVPKTRAAVLAIVCFVAGILFMHDVWAMIGLGLWGYALIYGCVWLYKFNRDRKINTQIQASRQQPPAELPVTRSHPDSFRLIVPPQRPKPDGM